MLIQPPAVENVPSFPLSHVTDLLYMCITRCYQRNSYFSENRTIWQMNVKENGMQLKIELQILIRQTLLVLQSDE